MPKVTASAKNYPHLVRPDGAQLKFCEDDCKSLRLLAPAGSGKTQAILWRCLAVAKKAQQNNSACKSLIITFTRVARDELRDRIRNDSDFESIAGAVEVNTLNAWGFRWLKNRMHNPRLLTSSKERKFLVSNDLQPIWQNHPDIKEILTDNRRRYKLQDLLMDKIDFLKGLGFRHDKHTDAKRIFEHLSWLINAGLKNHVIAFTKWLIELEIIQNDEEEHLIQVFERFMLFWIDSVRYLHSTAKLSLEDQKYWTLVELEELLKQKKFTTGIARYHHIMVDEFQDINVLDLNLLSTIAKINKSELTIIGDDDQAIYEWRGASPKFIIQPDQFIAPKYVSHLLNINYRCPSNIVAHSQQLIKHNSRRVNKNVKPASGKHAQIDVVEMPSVEDSVSYVVTLVKELLSTADIQKIALISRKRSQIIPYQIVFAGDDIPFYAAEDLNVMLSETFGQLKQLLLLKAHGETPMPFGPDPAEGLLKLCDKVKKYPLKKEERGKILSFVRSSRPKTVVEATKVFASYDGPLKGDNKNGKMTAEFHHAITRFLASETVADSILSLSEYFSGLQKDYGKSLDDIFYADPPFFYLSAYAERYGNDLTAFYEDVEKAIETLVHIPSEENEETDDAWKRKLHLMTALRAKGKEFDVVIILDCNNGIWPSKLADTDDQLEAERRVFYVAFTRAKKRITLMVNRQMFGQPMTPSPYLREMGLL